MDDPSTLDDARLHQWTWSPQIDALVAALSAAQGKLKHAEKSRTNPHLKSQYATLADCWAACRGPLSEAGLCIMQPIERTDAGVLVTTIMAHSSGQWVRCSLEIPCKGGPQDIGSAATYGRRYGLCALVGIAPDDDDDDDGEAAERAAPPSDNRDRRDDRRALDAARKTAFERWNILEALLTARDGRAPSAGAYASSRLGEPPKTAADYATLTSIINEEISSLQGAP